MQADRKSAHYHPVMPSPLKLPHNASARRSRGGHFVINGSDGLAYRLAWELCNRYGADVVVVMTKQQYRDARDFTEIFRVRLEIVERVDDQEHVT